MSLAEFEWNEAVPSLPSARKGRAALSNRDSRFSLLQREPEPTAADADADPAPAPLTEIKIELARSIVTSNRSPDLPFDESVNPYRGCEHGCIYCYARPSHAYLGLSPGLDFETRIFAKTNAAELLRKELQRERPPGSMIALGTNTDPYQPIERRMMITRSLLEVFAKSGQSICITTKSTLVTRDIDLLAPMAAQGRAKVLISIGMLDRQLARTLEPRANSPARRLEAIARLSTAGIPTGVIVAPIIPALTDRDLERVLEAAADAGASSASYVMLRLPREVADLFREWLYAHFPARARHVMSLINQMRGGKDNDSRFGVRMTGSGPLADLIERRFSIACKRLGLNAARELTRESAPAPQASPESAQLALFA